MRSQARPAREQHAGQVEGALPHVAFESHAKAAISVQVAKPLSVLRVRKVLIRPVVDLLVPVGVSLFTG